MKKRFLIPGLILVLFVFTSIPGLAQECEGDFEGDGDVDGTDLAIFAADFGRTDCAPNDLLNRILELESKVAQLEDLLQNVSRPDTNTILFSNVNVQIVDGSGDTEGTVNGRGNLIVGYNELRDYGNDRQGSHNIVVGRMNNYSSYGGLIVGRENNITGTYNGILAGVRNTVSGNYSSVSGGYFNLASNNSSSVCGGRDNEATGSYSTVCGGIENIASASNSTIAGGAWNEAQGDSSSIFGGRENEIAPVGSYTTVTGGRNNDASGEAALVAGGRGNWAIGDYSFIGGGGDEWSLPPGNGGNVANGDYSTIVGGRFNRTGNFGTTQGKSATVTGGFNNAVVGQDDWAGGGCNFCED